MDKKYELTEETKEIGGKTLYRIKAVKDFTLHTGEEVHVGDLGGLVESEKNLEQDGNCWIADNACAFDSARVCNNAIVRDTAYVFEYAVMADNATVCNHAMVQGSVLIKGDAMIADDVIISGYTQIGGSARIM